MDSEIENNPDAPLGLRGKQKQSIRYTAQSFGQSDEDKFNEIVERDCRDMSADNR